MQLEDVRRRMRFYSDVLSIRTAESVQKVICRKEDVAKFQQYKKDCEGKTPTETRTARWFQSSRNNLFYVSVIGSEGGYIACPSCGEICTIYHDSYGPASYRAIHYNHPTICLSYDDEGNVLSTIELEHWRVRNEKLLNSMSVYWKLDDRLLEQLFDKLLSVLPFEIAYSIMYNY